MTSHNPFCCKTIPQSVDPEDDDVGKTKTRQDIMMEHLITQRLEFTKTQTAGPGEAMVEIGTIVDFNTVLLPPSTGIISNGFQVRGGSLPAQWRLEESIREKGWVTHAGNLMLCEIPYAPAEIEELKERGMVSQDWEPPILFTLPEKAKQGSMFFHSSDAAHRMHERRFGLLDGNNRMRALQTILAEKPTLLDNVSVNATLISLNPYNSQHVFAACLRMNRPCSLDRDDEKDDAAGPAKRHKVNEPSSSSAASS
jgi:hypothetical protein